MPISILVTRRPPGSALNLLTKVGSVDLWPVDEIMPREQLLARVDGVDALYCMLTDQIDRELLDAAPKLRVISTMAVGVDNVDLIACTRRGIPVGHTPGVLTEATADLAMGLVLVAARRIVEGTNHVLGGRWGEWQPDLLLGTDVHSSVVGIVGMGRIGEAVARRARGFGMSIVYTGPHAKPEIEEALAAERRDLSGLLAVADHIVITAPLNADTYHLINAASIRLMKPTATLVNVARGPLVDTEALATALASGAIGAAGLDVTDPEPLPADHPLALLPNCVVTPHIGSASVQSRADMADLAARNLISALAGDPMEACANPAVYL
ncbi:MAG: D-glycerate dehydrogenase [Actinomycetota bacterium]|nr:D-glycerate dehydrogenase [Actinomycetota bacterium]